MKLWMIIICMLISFSATAEIYKSVDQNGVVTFSDQPDSHSETVQLPKESLTIKSTSFTSTNATTSTDATDKTLVKHVDYTSFTMSSPKDQDTIYNQSEIPVSVDIAPALQEGDTIQFLLNGSPVGTPAASTSGTIPKVENDKAILERGTQTLSANVLDAAGNVLKTTPSITVYIHYTSILQPKPR